MCVRTARPRAPPLAGAETVMVWKALMADIAMVESEPDGAKRIRAVRLIADNARIYGSL